MTIHWPEQSRLIPAAANSIRISIKQSDLQIAEKVIARPAGGGSTVATFDNLPLGMMNVVAAAYPQVNGSGIAQAAATSNIQIQGDKAASLSLILESTIDRLDITPSSVTIGIGKSVTLSAVAKNAGNSIVLTSAFYWNSADISVATVDQTGLVKGLATGAGKTTTIKVTETESGKSATFTINVIKVPSPVTQKATTLQINPGHSGSTNFGVPISFPDSPAWSVDMGSRVSYPIIADGLIFVTTQGSPTSPTGYGTRLHALDAATGQYVWGPITIPGPYFWSGLTYNNGKVFVLSFDGVLRSFVSTTGVPLWTTQLPMNIFDSAPNAANGMIYMTGSSVGGWLFAVNAATGSLVWSSHIGDVNDGSPALSTDNYSLFVSSTCESYKFDAGIGALFWHNGGPCYRGNGMTPVYANGRLYLRDRDTPANNRILDADTGIQVGTFPGRTLPALTSTIGVFLNQGTLRSVRLASDQELWSFTGDGQLITTPIIVNQTAIIGSSSGMVYALDLITGSVVWNGSAGAGIDGPNEHGSYPTNGLSAGEGYLVVPAGSRLTAWRIDGQ